MSGRKTTSNASDYEFQIAPEGNTLAICFGIAYLGHVPKVYQGKEDGTVDQVMFGFELCNEKAVFNEEKGEEPFGIWTFPYTNSIAPKANLAKFILSWRNKPKFTDEEIADGFDLSKCVGQPCQLGIVHTQNKENTYANVKSISSLMKGTAVPAIHNKPFVFDIVGATPEMKENFFRLPKWIREKVRGSKEYKEQNLNWPEPDEAGNDSNTSSQQQPSSGNAGSEDQGGGW
jgi:hypothetical protein